MKLMLTSFEVSQSVQEIDVLSRSLFYRMPPVRSRINNLFVPDYAVLLLCDQIVVDKISFELLQKPRQPYRLISETMTTLYHEGFVELVDFNSILSDNETLFHQMLVNDLDYTDWEDVLDESLDIWKQISTKALRLSDSDIQFQKGFNSERLANLPSSYTNDEFLLRMLLRSEIREHNSVNMAEKALFPHLDPTYPIIRAPVRTPSFIRWHFIPSYLSYVNANILISNKLDVGFHDWADFLPFYERKFLSAGIELEEQKLIDASHAFFEISFPEFSITNTKTLIKVLQDKRVIELRNLIQDAIDNKVTFDEDFAKKVLKEVLKSERTSSRFRNIVSYLTMPINFIPGIGPLVGTVLPKLTEEAVGKVIEREVSQSYRWFYMLSDVVEKTNRRENLG